MMMEMPKATPLLARHPRVKYLIVQIYWLEVTEPSATNLACICKINLWGVVWRGGLLDLASESHRVIRVGT